MCGIVGYVGNQEAVPILIGGLAKLEYRGYDSAGVAIQQGQKINVRRSVGKLVNLQKSLQEKELSGMVGIGHTRWATHGKPSEQNAHPHRSKGCVLVHNGIIENYQPLKQQLEKEGYKFQSETDTEVLERAGIGGCRSVGDKGRARKLCAGGDLREGAGNLGRRAVRLSAGGWAHQTSIVCRVRRDGDVGAHAGCDLP